MKERNMSLFLLRCVFFWIWIRCLKNGSSGNDAMNLRQKVWHQKKNRESCFKLRGNWLVMLLARGIHIKPWRNRRGLEEKDFEAQMGLALGQGKGIQVIPDWPTKQGCESQNWVLLEANHITSMRFIFRLCFHKFGTHLKPWRENMVGMTLPWQKPFPEAGCTDCKISLKKTCSGCHANFQPYYNQCTCVYKQTHFSPCWLPFTGKTTCHPQIKYIAESHATTSFVPAYMEGVFACTLHELRKSQLLKVHLVWHWKQVQNKWYE